MHRKVQLIVSGGIRNGADVAKALALGADAVSIGTAALYIGDNDPKWEDEYNAFERLLARTTRGTKEIQWNNNTRPKLDKKVKSNSRR